MLVKPRRAKWVNRGRHHVRVGLKVSINPYLLRWVKCPLREGEATGFGCPSIAAGATLVAPEEEGAGPRTEMDRPRGEDRPAAPEDAGAGLPEEACEEEGAPPARATGEEREGEMVVPSPAK
jgi:hypothetical protein